VDINLVKDFTDGLFRKLLGLILVIGGGVFLWEAAFPASGSGKFTGEVVGFIMGTALTTVIAFYYHTSQSSSEKSKQIEKLTVDGGADEEKL